MTKLYARCRGGARIHEAAPHGNWKILTILGAMSTRGMIATMTIEEATDTDIFRKRVVFPSGNAAGSSLTMWSWIRQKGPCVEFAGGVRLQRSGRLLS